MQGVKKDRELKTDARGFVREALVPTHVVADTTSDLKLKNAFVRRGLAFDQAQVMSFSTHEKLVALFFTEYLREQPVGFARVSQDQLMRADRDFFRRLQELTRGGIRPSMDGSRPIDGLMQGVLDSAAVQMLLLPLRGGGGGPKLYAEGENGQPGEGKSRRAKKNAKRKATEMEKKNQTTSQRDKGGKGEKKGDRNKDSPTMPRALLGNSSKTADGRNICFSFNLPGGCSEKIARGGKCHRGLHVCCKPGCAAAHPLAEHPG
jgi:hypothetical protein